MLFGLLGREVQASTQRPAGRLAFVRGNDIYTVNADGSDLTQLTRAAGDNLSPAWAPDGTHLAFASSRDGNGEIYVMAADGTQQTRLTTSPVYEDHPTWAPDGTRIAYETQDQIVVRQADGTQPLTVTASQPDTVFGPPHWAPDGLRLVCDGTVAPGDVRLFLIQADGSSMTDLGAGRNPQWAPDGTRLAFLSAEGLVVSAPDGTQRTPLGWAGSDPVWSPDSTRLALSSAPSEGGSFDLYLINADGTGAQQVTHGPYATGGDFETAWHPQGTVLAFVRHQTLQLAPVRVGVYLINTDGTGEQKLPGVGGHSPTWQPQP